MFRPELAEADADDDEATEDMSIYRRMDDDVSVLSLNLFQDGRTVLIFVHALLPIMLDDLCLTLWMYVGL